MKFAETPYFLVLSCFFSVFVFWRLSKLFRSIKGSRINKRGKNGEKKAVKWLKKHGFRNISEQEIKKSIICVNGKNRVIRANPDIIAIKGNEHWVIEVKTGGAANINKAETRRQIRESACLYPNSKLGFFDADKMELSEIVFPELSGNIQECSTNSKSGFLIWFLMGLIVGFVIIWFIK